VNARPTVTIVIPGRNAARHIDRCLTAIRAQSATLPVVVVDCGSADDTAERARRWGATVVGLPGAAAGQARNVGARSASSEIVAFVDADNEVRGGWLDACAGAFEDQATAAAGQSYRTVDGPTWVQSTYDLLRVRPASRVDVEWIGAGNFAVRRAAFDAVGGFDERLHTCEDVALCAALRSGGYRVVAEPGMESVHHGDPATLLALFRGELWRGRDNLRVSLRPPRSLRSLVGLTVSALAAAGLVIFAVALLLSPWLGAIPAACAAAVAGAAVLTRAVMLLRAASRTGVRVGLAAIVAVAAAYEVARGLSLFYPGSHDARANAPLVKHEA
jgi:hypothetical protein